MFFITSKLLAFLIQPVIWIFLLLLMAIIFKKKRKKILIYTLCILYFFSNGFIFDEFSRLWEPKQKKIEDIEQKYDVGIVLCGVSDYDKEIKVHDFHQYADRIIYTERLYKKGIIKNILISGGNGNLFDDGYREASSLKAYLIENGIKKDNILIENKSRNTRENIKYSTKILRKKYPNGNFLLITSANHLRRSLLCCKQSQLDIDYYGTDYTKSYRSYKLSYILIPRANTLYNWELLIHEWIGYLVYNFTD